MNAFLYLGAFFRESLFAGLVWNWLACACVEVFFLVGLILALQRLLHNRLSLHWSYYLWLFVVLRLVFSLGLALVFPDAGFGLQFSPVSVFLFWVWAAGMFFVFLASFFRAVLFLGRLGRLPEVCDPQILALFAGCRDEMGIAKRVRLLESPDLLSPASAGCLRPVVLLPASALSGGLSAEELRFVFLHELSHLKRFDLFMQWVSFSLRMVFWFHPVVWYALWKMETDCELNCDALALSFLDEGQKYDYGRLLLKSMERLSSSSAGGAEAAKAVPALAGFCATGAQIRRRIRLISGFNRAEMRFVPHVDFVVIIALGLLVFNLPGQRFVSAREHNVFTPVTSANHMESDSYLIYRTLDEDVPAGAFCGQSFIANNIDVMGLGLDIGKDRHDGSRSLICRPVDLVLFKARAIEGGEGYELERELGRRRFFPARGECFGGRRDFMFVRPVPVVAGGRYVIGLQSHGLFSIKLRDPFFSSYPHGAAVRRPFLSRVARTQLGGRDYLFRIYSSVEPDYDYMTLYSSRGDAFLTPEDGHS